jgi:hypothetical protein
MTISSRIATAAAIGIQACASRPSSAFVSPEPTYRAMVAAWLASPPPPDSARYRLTGSGQLLQVSPTTRYAISEVEVQNYKLTRLLSLDSLGAVGSSVRRVVAALVEPAIAPGERLQWETCRLNGRPTPGIIAVVDTVGTDSFRVIRLAWLADPEGQGFRVVPVTGIVCENVGYGA